MACQSDTYDEPQYGHMEWHTMTYACPAGTDTFHPAGRLFFILGSACGKAVKKPDICGLRELNNGIGQTPVVRH